MGSGDSSSSSAQFDEPPKTGSGGSAGAGRAGEDGAAACDESGDALGEAFGDAFGDALGDLPPLALGDLGLGTEERPPPLAPPPLLLFGSVGLGSTPFSDMSTAGAAAFSASRSVDSFSIRPSTSLSCGHAIARGPNDDKERR